jgi:2'-5' RNA ligase
VQHPPPTTGVPLESVVLIPALEAHSLVGELREQFDPSARAGIPAHLTILFPFVPPDELTEQQEDDLKNVLDRVAGFDYSLSEVGEFEQGVVYLAPEPEEPFARLTREVSQHFGLLPFGGAHGDKPVPHLTVAVNQSAARRRQLGRQLSEGLPIHCRASEAWLMVGSNATRWQVARRLPLQAGVDR